MEAALGTEPTHRAAVSALFFRGFYVLPCSLLLSWFPPKGGYCMTGCKSGNLSFCSVAENFVTGCPFFLEGLWKMRDIEVNHAMTQFGRPFKKRLSLTKKNSNIVALRL